VGFLSYLAADNCKLALDRDMGGSVNASGVEPMNIFSLSSASFLKELIVSGDDANRGLKSFFTGCLECYYSDEYSSGTR